MAWILAVFLPPVYFMTRGKWGAAIINGFFYLSAIPLMFFAGIGIIPWMLCVAHAAYYLKGEWEEQQADRIANRAAARVQESLDAANKNAY